MLSNRCFHCTACVLHKTLQHSSACIVLKGRFLDLQFPSKGGTKVWFLRRTWRTQKLQPAHLSIHSPQQHRKICLCVYTNYLSRVNNVLLSLLSCSRLNYFKKLNKGRIFLKHKTILDFMTTPFTTFFVISNMIHLTKRIRRLESHILQTLFSQKFFQDPCCYATRTHVYKNVDKKNMSTRKKI